jgi:hypothetical protein
VPTVWWWMEKAKDLRILRWNGPGMNEFSVYQWFPDGQYEKVERLVSAEVALRRAASLSQSIGARLGTTVRVIITDGGDNITWEWKHGMGVIFPKE